LTVVSDVKGTTTDPVEKSMEILPLGPVVIIDTAGINDGTKEVLNNNSELGYLRVKATMRVLDKTDIAILVVDSAVGLQKEDKNLTKEFETRKIPYILVWNKCDLLNSAQKITSFKERIEIFASSKTGEGINELKEKLGHIISENKQEKYIIRDRLKQGDIIILVIPIDESAPKGRVILPQQNVLRECLDAHAAAICCQVDELRQIIQNIAPKYVITDSQVFNVVKDIVPENIVLTSFSILMANYKGNLNELVSNAKIISELKDGDIVLISEGCTHHRQCNDIGTVKFPKWIKEYTGKNIKFEFTQGGEFPRDLTKYSLIIHCGGCMLNEQEMSSRIKCTKEQGIPIVNYGMAIAYMNEILERAMEIFDE